MGPVSTLPILGRPRLDSDLQTMKPGVCKGDREMAKAEFNIEPATHAGRLSVEAIPTLEEAGAAEVAIYLDRAGLARLMETLRALEAQKTDQAHLLSDYWGSGPLTIERWRPDGWVTHHLKICLRPDGEGPREVRYRPG